MKTQVPHIATMVEGGLLTGAVPPRILLVAADITLAMNAASSGETIDTMGMFLHDACVKVPF